jgi:raffinose/stachyose/melibiose transport system permease protein
MVTTTDSTPAPATQAAVPARHKPKKERWGNPIVYFAALVLVALMIGPVLYIIVGGFRTNSQITANPAGLPNPWVVKNYLNVLTSATFWRQVGN